MAGNRSDAMTRVIAAARRLPEAQTAVVPEFGLTAAIVIANGYCISGLWWVPGSGFGGA